jgi:hypothetical protein
MPSVERGLRATWKDVATNTGVPMPAVAGAESGWLPPPVNRSLSANHSWKHSPAKQSFGGMATPHFWGLAWIYVSKFWTKVFAAGGGFLGFSQGFWGYSWG